jgi:NhaP-type Na+/H+ or K+/H+ antiporter
VHAFVDLVVVLVAAERQAGREDGDAGVGGWLLAALLLVAIRPLSCAVALAGSRMDRPGEKAFVSWFGVRGVAALYYTALIVGTGVLAPDEQSTLVATVIACVLLSIVVHGITAGPALSRLLTSERIRQRSARERASAPAPR